MASADLRAVQSFAASVVAYDEAIFALLIVTVFLLAWISWKYIEAPFRYKNRISQAGIFKWATASIVLLLALDGTLNVVFTPKVDPLAVNVQDCPGYDAGGSELVCKKIGTGNRLVVLFGDSHVLPLIDAFTEDAAMTYMFISIPGCPPLVGLERYDGIGNSSNCDKPRQLARYADQVASLQPEKIILVGRWTFYMHGWQKKNVLQKKAPSVAARNRRERADAAAGRGGGRRCNGQVFHPHNTF